MRKAGVITGLMGFIGLVFSLIIYLIWACFNEFPKETPTTFNITLVFFFLVFFTGVFLVGYSYKKEIISEIKQLYKQ